MSLLAVALFLAVGVRTAVVWTSGTATDNQAKAPAPPGADGGLGAAAEESTPRGSATPPKQRSDWPPTTGSSTPSRASSPTPPTSAPTSADKTSTRTPQASSKPRPGGEDDDSHGAEAPPRGGENANSHGAEAPPRGGENANSRGGADDDSGAADREAGPTWPTMEDEVIELTNKQRRTKGCGELTRNTKLRAAMRLHVRELARHGGSYLSHDSDDGRTFVQRAKAQGYASPRAENIARGQRTPSDVVQGWMNSPGHRTNMLNCDLTEIGVGVAESGGSKIWGQLFG